MQTKLASWESVPKQRLDDVHEGNPPFPQMQRSIVQNTSRFTVVTPCFPQGLPIPPVLPSL
ncbi:MAG: hypothetical protein D6741_01490 [Planctomycetota bacterium]|nr:MAG: hypothetical protein D6741_01490 [Planctomycetota bacterium]